MILIYFIIVYFVVVFVVNAFTIYQSRLAVYRYSYGDFYLAILLSLIPVVNVTFLLFILYDVIIKQNDKFFSKTVSWSKGK